MQESLARANEQATEAIGAMRTVRSFAAERAEIAGYRELLGETYSLNKRQVFAYSGYVIVNQVSLNPPLSISPLSLHSHPIMGQFRRLYMATRWTRILPKTLSVPSRT